MSKEDGGNAFPIPGLQEDSDFNGMTLRDYFAAKAMQAYITGFNAHSENHNWSNKDFAVEAYLVADEMLKARKP